MQNKLPEKTDSAKQQADSELSKIGEKEWDRNNIEK